VLQDGSGGLPTSKPLTVDANRRGRLEPQNRQHPCRSSEASDTTERSQRTSPKGRHQVIQRTARSKSVAITPLPKRRLPST